MVAALAMGLAAVTASGLLGPWPVHGQEAGDEASAQALAPDYRWAHFAQHPGGLMSNDVWSIIATEDAIWVGTDAGVSYYDGSWVNFVPPESGSPTGVAGDEANAVVPLGTVLALAAGSDGRTLHAGTDEGLAYRWDGTSWAEVADAGAPVLSILDLDGDVLLGTDDGIHTVGAGSESPQVMLEGMNIYALARASERVYAGTDSGLWRLAGDAWEEVRLDRAGVRNVYALSAIGDGGLAVGTPDGVMILDEQLRLLRNLPVSDELGRPALVQALADDAYGRLWAGTDGAGAYEFAAETYDGTAHGQAHDANVTIRYVRDVAVDADGSVWFGAPTGIYRYQVGMWHSDVQGDSVADPLNHINDLLVAADGTLWIATGGGGVRMKPDDGSEEIVFSLDEGVPSTALTLVEDERGDIWAGTFYGLFRYDDGAWALPEFNERLPDLTVTALLADSAPDHAPLIWIGTEGGLAVYDVEDESVRTVEEFDGLSVEALALDGLQRLWVGTTAQGAWVQEADGAWTQHVHVAGGRWQHSGRLRDQRRLGGRLAHAGSYVGDRIS